MTAPAVAHTAEFRRIASLPRRAWSATDLASLTSSLTEILRTPGGSMTLRSIQALALYEAGTEGGLFAPIGTGDGKTIITMLLAVVFGAERPLLLLPANLIEQTRREQIKLTQHWKIPTELRSMSYTILGLVDYEKELDAYAPDAIICDEAHKLKNRRAAVTRRVARYMVENPHTKFAALTGTPGESILEFAHILRWCLKLNAPIPMTNEETEEWAESLDDSSDEYGQRKPGALLELRARESGESDRQAARRGYRQRLTETPGVVATVGDGEHVDCPIYVRGIRYPVAPVTERNFIKLRGNDTDEFPGWMTPDEWPLLNAVDVWRHAQELALGLHYIWDPRPPPDWLYARRQWGKFVRETISRSRTFDSELHVANACDAGRLDATALSNWRSVRDEFTPNVVPVWHDTSALDACAEWMRGEGGGIVWTEHGFFAERLAEYTGVPYFGAGGFSATGLYIQDAVAGSAVVASIDANREGKNLQGLWNRNLIVCPPKSAGWWEQTIARTHRPGQTKRELIVDVLLGCRENFDACMKAIEGAKAIHDTTGKRQKLLMADVRLPSEWEIDGLKSARWTR
jgi:hypothetical protein